MARGAPTGARLGQSLSDILARTVTQAHEQQAPARTAERDRFVTAFMERMERELSDHIGEAFVQVANDPEAAQWARNIGKAVSEPTHQFESVITFAAGFLAAFQLAGAVVAPQIQAVASRHWTSDPVRPLDVQDLAVGSVRGLIDPADAAHGATQTGYGDKAFGIMSELALQWPSVGEVLELRRRELIDDAELDTLLKRLGLDHSVRPLLAHLQVSHMDPATAVMAAVQNHLSADQAKAILRERGIRPEDFEVMYETAGNPPGPGQLQDALNRGLITQEQFDQGVRESRIKNKYVELEGQLRVYLPPPRSVPTLLHNGAISKEKALELFRKNGLEPDMAAAYVASALHEKHVANKNLALGQITELYELRSITRPKAVELLADLGWDGEDADFILAIADNRRELRFHESAVGTVRARYITYRISRQQASTALDTLKVPGPERDDLIRLWDLEREANQKDLPESVIVAAVLRDLISADEGMRRLEQIGYAQPDAELLLAIAAAPAPRAPTVKQLTRSDIVKAFKAGDVSQTDAIAALVAMGYSTDDATFIIREAGGS